MAFCAVLFVAGCAPALPSLAGGSTTPAHRRDVGLGGSARVPFGQLRPRAGRADHTGAAPTNGVDELAARYEEAALAGGIVPVASARVGLPHHLDLGVLASGTMAQLSLRWERVLRDGVTQPRWVIGLAPYGGALVGAREADRGARDRDRAGRAGVVGVEVPVLYAVDFGSSYELWAGPRLGAEYLRGRFTAGEAERARASAWTLRAGAVLGVGIGLRGLHVLAELTAAYERWRGRQGDAGITRQGLVLIPAAALRVRF